MQLKKQGFPNYDKRHYQMVLLDKKTYTVYTRVQVDPCLSRIEKNVTKNVRIREFKALFL
jgi:hypothetical protein